ncbi:MAG: YkgJ family cysteine cluster protein [Bryobacteraceae bacterium]
MLKDLVQISRLGDQKRGENERLRRHLKTHEFVEKRLKRIAVAFEEEMDCTTCANCCRVATTTLVPRDVDHLARFLRLSKDKFLQQYTEQSPEEGLILKRSDETGCVFLDGNTCTVYEARPGTCEDFPHLVKGNGSLQSRMWQMIDRASYCPIVYNTLEGWKQDLNFSPRSK